MHTNTLFSAHQGLAVAKFQILAVPAAVKLLVALVAMVGMHSGLHAATAAAEQGHQPVASKPAADAATAEKASPDKTPVVDLKAAIREQMLGNKNLTLVVRDKADIKGKAASEPVVESKPQPPAVAGHAPATKPADAAASAHVPVLAVHVGTPRPATAHAPAVVSRRASRDYIKARAAALAGHEAPVVPDSHGEAHASDAHGGDPHWAYEGDNGPQSWGKLKPEFNTCAVGKRQSPINIEESMTLQGPAEPLGLNYTASTGSVVNNGHTIQVDVVGDNTLTVRGSVYKLVQMHFHTPSEEQVNYRSFAMVAHLVHKNNEGQLAVLAVLLEPGLANPLIDTVWTYMPLDVNDRVRLPAAVLDLNQLLPKDQRYYQFMGSLTTPPCTEGVLWVVLKTPAALSAAQIRLFQQLFPNNARPVQPVNGRPVRNAQ